MATLLSRGCKRAPALAAWFSLFCIRPAFGTRLICAIGPMDTQTVLLDGEVGKQQMLNPESASRSLSHSLKQPLEAA
jgi:hypothetical protein